MTNPIHRNASAAEQLSEVALQLEDAARLANGLCHATDVYLIYILQGITGSSGWRMPRGDTPQVLYNAINCRAIDVVASTDGVHLIATTEPYEDLTSVESVETALRRWESLNRG